LWSRYLVCAASVHADPLHSPRLDALAAAPNSANAFWERDADAALPIAEWAAKHFPSEWNAFARR
jgi:hypothetical protein